MASPSLTLPFDGAWRRLAAQSRPALDEHEKLTALIRGRLGAADAGLLAVPTFDAWTDDSSAWQSAGGGALQPASDTSGHFAAIARIQALADGLEPQGEAGRIAAHALRLAVITPTDAPAYFEDATTGAPVLANWGLAAPGQSTPDLTAPTAPTPPASAVAAETQDVAETPASPADGRRGWVALLPWLVTAGLAGLAIWLGLALAEPTPTVDVATTPPAAPAPDPLPDLITRLADLDAAIGQAGEAEERFGKACIAHAPTPTPPTVVEAPPPAPLDEPPPPRAETPPVIAEVTPTPAPPRRPPGLIDPLPRAVERAPLSPPRIQPTPAPPPVIAEAPPPAATPERCSPTWRAGREPRMVFVVDGSGSMRERIPGASSRIGAAKQSIGRVVRSLHKDIRIGMVSFSDCGATDNTGYYSAPERGRLIREVESIQPGRATSLAASIRRGAALANRRAETVLVVLSDGADTCGQDPCAAAREAKRQKPGLTINVIDLSGGKSGRVLQCIAGAGGGKVYAPGSAQQMADQIQQATGQPDASGC